MASKNDQNITPKDKCIFDVKLKKIEGIDRDSTTLSFKIMFGTFSVLASLFSIGISAKIIDFNNSSNSITIILIFIAILIIVSGIISNNINKYIDDLYSSLLDAVNRNKIKELVIPDMKSFELIIYRKKFK